MEKKFKVISEDLQKNLIEFLDEVQFEAAANTDNDSMHKVNFCGWAIKELLNSYDGYLREIPKKKSRDQYLEETFMDWNLPDMSDKDYEKLVDTFDTFLRGWEEEYYKNNPKGKPKQDRPFKPYVEDVAEYMSLEEIEEFLKDDRELTDWERFELYYEERERAIEREDSISYDELLRKSGIKPAGWKPKKK